MEKLQESPMGRVESLSRGSRMDRFERSGDHPCPDRFGSPNLVKCFAVVAIVVVAFALWLFGYIQHHRLPQWIWDLYDYKTWPLNRVRHWFGR
jgi:hypothetical protein